jgi:FkbM family methyltransferase
MFRELSNFYASPEAMDVVMYPMRSLDSLALSDPAHFGSIDFVKLDVQGAELEVLEGALTQLNVCVEFVLLEAPLRAFNEVRLEVLDCCRTLSSIL